MWDISLFPDSASTIAGEVDQLTFALTFFSLVFATPVAGLIVYFAIKYHRGSRADRTGAIPTSTALETAWIVVPLLLALGIFAWSTGPYIRMYEMPADGLDVYAVGIQWMWQFEHPTGQREINELHVPLGRKVRLTMIAQDVIHSFYVPAFRVKRDVVPGRYTTLWFEATKTGSFHLFCAEYCGTEHSGMIGQVVVMEPRQYQDWLSQRPLDLEHPIPEHLTGDTAVAEAPSLASEGETLFQSLGCANCHRMDGSGPGPSLANLLGSEVQLASDETVVADEQYIRRSILDPNAQTVAGYPPIMPTYAGQIDEDKLFQLVAYIRNLTTPEGQGNAAETPATEGDGTDATDQEPEENATPALDGEAQEGNP